uniref:Ammonium transporter AmtB-like domain-containing protein n=1 Tax=Biomphalaria glabrata TaxID=6526 RepID=A0A2C9KQQ4_BIOGL
MNDFNDDKIAFFFYQAMFASTATTIVAGAVSERCEFIAYLIYSFFLTAFIYPVVTHWGWTTQGWLYLGYDFDINGLMETIRYQDYGGSGLVHLVGGTSAFIATCFLGPRLGRFHKETGTVINIRGHSVASRDTKARIVASMKERRANKKLREEAGLSAIDLTNE